MKALIADILMPEMDGLTLLSKIRSEASIRHVPVIVCTSKNDMETVEKTDTVTSPVPVNTDSQNQ